MENEKLLVEKKELETGLCKNAKRRNEVMAEMKALQQEFSKIQEKDLTLDASYKTVCKMLGIEKAEDEFRKIWEEFEKEDTKNTDEKVKK